MTVDGLIMRQSNHTPAETMQRLMDGLAARGVPVLAHIDHAAAAAKAGLTLRPTDLLVFGNAKAGTPLMAASQTLGIDLPLKMLVWQDQEGRTWLGYNDPVYLAHRHGAEAGGEQILSAMRELLAALAATAAG
ncbi:MAG TPA: DUF302 domain-containing protein [Rhizomicrobium sp.]|jgi:uncharacterized protein (DUF302 family)|nr:DUF302 domain-containing protein [Rhizomicrobium sp.]